MQQNWRILSVGYCVMQTILAWESPIAYSAGHYGWSCDYYLVKTKKYGDVIICTGYNPIKSKNMNVDYKIIRKYEEKANGLHDRKQNAKLLEQLLNKLAVQVEISPYAEVEE